MRRHPCIDVVLPPKRDGALCAGQVGTGPRLHASRVSAGGSRYGEKMPRLGRLLVLPLLIVIAGSISRTTSGASRDGSDGAPTRQRHRIEIRTEVPARVARSDPKVPFPAEPARRRFRK
jgi:hypothetical protein